MSANTGAVRNSLHVCHFHQHRRSAVTTTRRAYLVGVGLAVLGSGWFWSADRVAAKPPGGGGGNPPTAGQIFFKYQNVTRQMNTDGSGKVALALPTGLKHSPAAGPMGASCGGSPSTPL
jgi:hypothetical protein